MSRRRTLGEEVSPLDERTLIRRAKRGDQPACRELVDLHKDRLFAFVWRVIRNHHDAEEVCQDAFLRAFAALDSFNEQYKFSTWLFTIGYRLCLNRLRRKPAVSGGVELDSVPDRAPDVSEAVAASEQAQHMERVIWSAVDRLSAPQKASVMLFYRERMGCQEIAEVLDMPAATVKSHLHRARSRLREMLTEDLGEDAPDIRLYGAG